MTAPRWRLVLLATACNLAIWILAGFFATSEFYRRAIAMGGGYVPPIGATLAYQMVVALNWAMLTPLIVMLARALPLQPPHRMRNLVAIVVFIPYLAVFRAAFGGAVHKLGEHEPVTRDFVSLSIGIRTHQYAAILAAIFFVYNLVEAQREAARRERQRVKAQTLLARAEIDELRTRFQPEFATRMLRHIGAVLREQPNTADALIVSLSEILRRSMARGTELRIPLADELEHLDRCLDLCRAGGRLAVTARYAADDDVLACRVPARVLQPGIEKMVLDLIDRGGGSVEVRCAREGSAVRVDVASMTLRIPCEEEVAA